MRFISHHEIEWRLVHDRVEVVIVCKFSMGDLVCPGTRVGPTEDPKVGFNLLVNMFCFTIRLGVVGGRKGEIIVEELSELLGEGTGELWAMIGDDLVVEPKTEIHFMEKEGSYSLGEDGFLCGVENYPLCKAMVDHNQQRIETRGSGKVSDEVAGDLLEGVRCTGFDQGEQEDGGVHV